MNQAIALVFCLFSNCPNPGKRRDAAAAAYAEPLFICPDSAVDIPESFSM
jgi:hypothetical protein